MDPKKEAVRTRLELATYGVTGRYSNQLNYRTGYFFSKAGAKVLLFFDIRKYFCIFFQKLLLLLILVSKKERRSTPILLTYYFISTPRAL